MLLFKRFYPKNCMYTTSSYLSTSTSSLSNISQSSASLSPGIWNKLYHAE